VNPKKTREKKGARGLMRKVWWGRISRQKGKYLSPLETQRRVVYIILDLNLHAWQEEGIEPCAFLSDSKYVNKLETEKGGGPRRF